MLFTLKYTRFRVRCYYEYKPRLKCILFTEPTWRTAEDAAGAQPLVCHTKLLPTTPRDICHSNRLLINPRIMTLQHLNVTFILISFFSLN